MLLRPVDLGGLEALCAPFGVSCGFGRTRVLAAGNAHLDVEEIRTWEVRESAPAWTGRYRNTRVLIT